MANASASASGYTPPEGCRALNDAKENFDFVVQNDRHDTESVKRASELKIEFFGRFETIWPLSRYDHNVKCYEIEKESRSQKVVILCYTCDKNVLADFKNKTITDQSNLFNLSYFLRNEVHLRPCIDANVCFTVTLCH